MFPEADDPQFSLAGQSPVELRGGTRDHSGADGEPVSLYLLQDFYGHHQRFAAGALGKHLQWDFHPQRSNLDALPATQWGNFFLKQASPDIFQHPLRARGLACPASGC